MVRLSIILIGLISFIHGNGLQSGKAYEAIPVKVNGDEVSNRVLYRYGMLFGFAKDYNTIHIVSKIFGNRDLFYYKTKKGYDYYADEKSYLTVRVDTKGTVYIQKIDAKGYKGDWLMLKTITIKSKKPRLKIGSLVLCEYGRYGSRYSSKAYVTKHYKNNMIDVVYIRGGQNSMEKHDTLNENDCKEL
ncbi:MAG: hypothetical protein DRJ64_09760 [Thermoprotei archaeon]|nr:MAG: hypothetical protein DRJ64_09760 [Thermoprotei archaeon]